jgi:hypothetical protein
MDAGGVEGVACHGRADGASLVGERKQVPQSVPACVHRVCRLLIPRQIQFNLMLVHSWCAQTRFHHHHCCTRPSDRVFGSSSALLFPHALQTAQADPSWDLARWGAPFSIPFAPHIRHSPSLFSQSAIHLSGLSSRLCSNAGPFEASFCARDVRFDRCVSGCEGQRRLVLLCECATRAENDRSFLREACLPVIRPLSILMRYVRDGLGQTKCPRANWGRAGCSADGSRRSGSSVEADDDLPPDIVGHSTEGRD